LSDDEARSSLPGYNIGITFQSMGLMGAYYGYALLVRLARPCCQSIILESLRHQRWGVLLPSIFPLIALSDRKLRYYRNQNLA
jgi:hypothetical protein